MRDDAVMCDDVCKCRVSSTLTSCLKMTLSELSDASCASTAYKCQFFANLQFASERYQGFVDIIVHGGCSRAYLILQPTYRSRAKSLPRNVGFYDWRFSMWRAMAPTKCSFLPVHIGIPSLQPRKP